MKKFNLKKMASLVMVLSLLVTFVPLTAEAATVKDNGVCQYEKKIHLIKDERYTTKIDISKKVNTIIVTSVKSDSKNLKVRTENVGKKNKWDSRGNYGTKPTKLTMLATKNGNYKISFKTKYKLYNSSNWNYKDFTINVYVTNEDVIKKLSIAGNELEDVNNGIYENYYFSPSTKGKIHIDMGKGYELTNIKVRGDYSKRAYNVSHHSSGGKKATVKNNAVITLNNKCSGTRTYTYQDYVYSTDGKSTKVDKTATEIFEYPVAETEIQINYKDKYTKAKESLTVYVYVETE